MQKKIEILAPAGSMECLKAALAAGADAVYAGGNRFGARAYADNFDEEGILEAIDYVHLHGRKLYLTVNTLLKEREIEKELYSYLLPLYKQGLDAVIVQDLGVLRFVKRHFPGLPIHASTQMTITGTGGAKLLEEEGAERIVTARELQLEEIRKISEETDVEIESFVHGALCYCYSGQCLFSSFLGGRSGNRGQCAQPCRMKYRGEGEAQDAYLLSLKDICTLDYIPELIQAGIHSFKIEGRMKKPEYVAGTTAMYRKYTDLYFELKEKGQNIKESFRVSEKDKQMLQDLYNRGGFHGGYYHTKRGKEMVSLLRPNHAGVQGVRIEKKEGRFWVGKALVQIHAQDVLELPVQKGKDKHDMYTCGFSAEKGEKVRLSVSEKSGLKPGMILSRVRNQQLLTNLNEEYTSRKIKEKINGKFMLSSGEFVTLTITCGNVEATVAGERAQEALRQPMDRDRIRKQLEKTGNTPFEFEKLDIEIQGNPFIPIQSLNEIRREALDNLYRKIVEEYRRDDIPMPGTEERREPILAGEPIFSASIETKEQLEILLKHSLAGRVYVDASIVDNSWDDRYWKGIIRRVHSEGKEIYLTMPYIFRDATQEEYKASFEVLCRLEFDGILIRNLESYYFLKERGFAKPIITDYNLYQFNHFAKDFWREKGITHMTAPLELTSGELGELGLGDSEMMVYGYLPMMVSAGCVKKTLGQCKKQSGVMKITDRYRKEFAVKNYCNYCYNMIYNCAPLYLGDKLAEVKALNPCGLRLGFTTESGDETERILMLFERAIKGENPEFTLGEFTRGHLKKGIK